MITARAAARSLTFTVPGQPQTKGSARAFVPLKWAKEAVAQGRAPRAVITNDNPNAEAWQKEIAALARIALNRGEMFAGPVGLDLVFYLQRPLRLKHGIAHTTRPDVDKLARCVLDGLTGVIYADDGQVVAIRLAKQYAPIDGRPGVAVTITEATVADPAAPPLFT